MTFLPSYSLYSILPQTYTATLDYMGFTLDYMDFTLNSMDFTLDYTEIPASDWSEAQSAQSREIALREILIRDVCVLSWGNFDLGKF